MKGLDNPAQNRSSFFNIFLHYCNNVTFFSSDVKKACLSTCKLEKLNPAFFFPSLANCNNRLTSQLLKKVHLSVKPNRKVQPKLPLLTHTDVWTSSTVKFKVKSFLFFFSISLSISHFSHSFLISQQKYELLICSGLKPSH